MTTVENERLAIVETKVDLMQTTVASLDTKLDSVILYIAGQKGEGVERRRESMLLRWVLSIGIPAVISVCGYVVGKMT